MASVVVLIVNFRTYDDLSRCLSSLAHGLGLMSFRAAATTVSPPV